MNNRSRLLLAASLAGALAAPMVMHASDEPKADAGGKVHCYGVNKCKGVGECSGPGHGCAGMNSCKHQGYIDMEKDLCLKIDGGRLTPAEPKK